MGKQLQLRRRQGSSQERKGALRSTTTTLSRLGSHGPCPEETPLAWFRPHRRSLRAQGTAPCPAWPPRGGQHTIPYPVSEGDLLEGKHRRHHRRVLASDLRRRLDCRVLLAPRGAKINSGGGPRRSPTKDSSLGRWLATRLTRKSRRHPETLRPRWLSRTLTST